MSTHGLWFGIVGFLLVIGVNVGYQREMRKTFRDRKLI